ncbi:hypothetical protein ACFX15_032511 [Malus domestica]
MVRTPGVAIPPTLNPSSGSGRVEKFGGLDTYLVGSPDSKLAVLLLSDIFGYDAPNLRKMADKLAAAGFFFVVVPDFFYGDPFELGEEGFATLPGWIKHHEPDKAFEDTKPLLETLKSKGISAVGAVGFCYGAKVVVELSKHDLIQAAAMCHPAFVTLDDIKAVKVPTQILGAEIDHMSPPEVVKQFEEALAAKPEIKSRVKIFPKVEHGWTTRYNDEDEAACKAAEEAYQDLLEWLQYTCHRYQKLGQKVFHFVLVFQDSLKAGHRGRDSATGVDALSPFLTGKPAGSLARIKSVHPGRSAFDFAKLNFQA